MGMSAGWPDRSSQRVKERINAARAPYYALLRDPSVLEEAMRELTGIGDRPNERTALALANVLGVLTPDEYPELIRMTLDFLQQATSQAAGRAEQQLEEQLSGVSWRSDTHASRHPTRGRVRRWLHHASKARARAPVRRAAPSICHSVPVARLWFGRLCRDSGVPKTDSAPDGAAVWVACRYARDHQIASIRP
jgi:hypothetical protein